MSWPIHWFGARRPPRTARRRLAWLIVTVLGFAVLVTAYVVAAVEQWGLLAADEEDASAWLAVLYTALGLGFAASGAGTACIGARTYREQRAEERADAASRA